MSKHVYREGDRVRILRGDRAIRRVGYAITPETVKDEVAESQGFKDALVALGMDPHRHGRAYRRLLSAACYAEVEKRGFGGRERSIHYKEVVPYGELHTHDMAWDATGREATVSGKYVVRTGRYYPPCSWTSYEGEHDYESGGLEDAKTHVILRLGYGDFEACDVELVRAAPRA